MSEAKKPGFFERLFGFGAAKPKPEEPTPPARRRPPVKARAKKEPLGEKKPPKMAKSATKPKVHPKVPPPAGPMTRESAPDSAPKQKFAPTPAGPATAPGVPGPEARSPAERTKGRPAPAEQVGPSAPLPKGPVPLKVPKDKPKAAAAEPKRGWFTELRQGLARTSAALTDNIAGVLTKRKLDEETLDELEEVLIKADLGVVMAGRIRDAIAKSRHERGLTPAAVRQVLANEIASLLRPLAQPFALHADARPHVFLVVGVNGTGKTTTIAKMAHQFHQSGLEVMLAAADTFRAAAIDQLKVWGGRAGAEVVAKDVGADPAGVAYEALERAKAEGKDVLLIDTAGRLQNKTDLMGELAKIVRVLKKLDDDAPHDVVLVLDATTGQNALSQVQIFQEIAGVTSLIVTKLDGTARGGILVAIAERFALPINAIGIGEGIDHLEPFDADDFARAIAGTGAENEAAA